LRGDPVPHGNDMVDDTLDKFMSKPDVALTGDRVSKDDVNNTSSTGAVLFSGL